MARKAKLDILDISLDEKAEGPLNAETAQDNDVISGEEQTDEKFSSRLRAWVRKPAFRIIMISSAVIGSIIGVSIWSYYGQDVNAPVAQVNQGESAASVASTGKVAFFEGFVVDLKDEKGDIRIAFCDIALELENSQVADTVGNRGDVRNVIYTILKRKKVEALLLPEARNRLKTEWKNELNRLFGQTLVKEVYFSRFEVI
ncbi:MAG: flagellar basal body-associated FliL family protein [Deltaproteobacteria bacterium]|nr:flagellar basal body-associated FliL family protein [Deltaproteobacteria bacterium]